MSAEAFTAEMGLLFDAIVPPLGWTLVHSLWQGCLVAALLALLLRAMRGATPGPRYAACCGAMGLLVAAALATFVTLRWTSQQASDATSGPLPAAIRIGPAEESSSAASLASAMLHPPRTEPLTYVVGGWLFGVAALALWHAGGWLWLQRMRRGPSVERWQASVDRLATKLGIAHVRLIESVRIDVPAVVGALRPVILVPVGVLNDLSAAQVEAILAHELAHVRRHDYVVNLLQAAVETLMFYHPATWWISHRIREERENCCDDVATQMCGDATVYASALAALEERRMPAITQLAPAVNGGGALLDRVRRILRLPPPMRRTSRVRSLAAAALAVACVAVPLAINARQSRAADEPTNASQPATVPTSSRSSVPTIVPATWNTKVGWESSMTISPIQPDDLKVEAQDYRLSPGDLIAVSIADLVGAGVESVKTVRISETGQISLPHIGLLKIAGLSVADTEKAIAKTYGAKQVIADAQVSVTIQEARGQTFSIVGALDRPGQYQVVQPDFRVLDALAVAGGRPGDMSALRVIRKVAGAGDEKGDEKADAKTNAGQRVIEVPLDRLVAGDVEVNLVIRRGDTLIATAPPKPEAKFVKIVVGKESLLHQGQPIGLEALKRMLDRMPPAERRVTVLEVAAAAPDVTVERFFNASRQLSDLVKQYGLAHLSQTGIQPTAEAKVVVPGEYYMDGMVKRPGVYSLTARNISLKQAVAAAGGLEDAKDAIVTVIRREADETESFPIQGARVSELFDGKVKDLYLKPNDIVRIQPDALEPLLKERAALEAQLQERARLVGDRHVDVVQLKRQIEALDQRVDALRGGRTASPTRPSN